MRGCDVEYLEFLARATYYWQLLVQGIVTYLTFNNSYNLSLITIYYSILVYRDFTYR
jgi:hypothetical protein